MMIRPRLRRPVLAAAARVLAVLALAGCTAAGSGTLDSRAEDSGLALIREALDRAQEDYVVPVDREKFVADALKGALTGLDAHSDYMDEKDYREMLNDSHGEFGGVGMEITLDRGVPKVVSPIDDTPAARAGLRAGDIILKIAAKSTESMGLREVVNRLRGAPGTPVPLTILRKDEPAFEVLLTRTIIHVVSVKAHLEPNRIGYARITTFTEKTQPELAKAIAEMKQAAGGQLAGFVLDLRNDPGGLLYAAVDVAGDFLDGGTVVTTRGRRRGDDHIYSVPRGGDRVAGTPIAVLINGASASAAEIVAGALQDAHRATVIGTRSFGKGSVQTVIPLNGRGALRLTTARYYTPAGRSIQDEGIAPDLVASLPKDAQSASGIILREADLPRALRNTGSLDGKTARALAGETAQDQDEGRGADEAPIAPTLIGTAKDAQLAAAIDFLRRRTAKTVPPARS